MARIRLVDAAVKKPILALTALALLAGGGPLSAAEHPGYETAERRTAGTGRFYMGREIAFVMGHQAADWLERPRRTAEERPDEVVAAMGLEPDHVVADIGAGTGYFSFRIARAVPRGRVLAVDIQPEMLEMIRARMAAEDAANILPVQGRADDPGLAPESVDVALMVDAYHEFSHPFEMMRGIWRALRPGGRVVLVEYRGEDPAVPIRPLHKMTELQAVREMSVFGLEWTDTMDFLPWQHMMIFTKVDGRTDG